MLKLFRVPAVSDRRAAQLVECFAATVGRIETEFCFYVQTERALPAEEGANLRWLLRETFEPEQLSDSSFLEGTEDGGAPSIVEVGPRLSFTSAFSTNAVSICASCGVPVTRLERYRRYRLYSPAGGPVDEGTLSAFAAAVHDRMTEWRLTAPLLTFDSGLSPEPVRHIPLLRDGKAALEAINKDMGLSMDAWDIDFYYTLFATELKRDPTDVELFDISQSNSEHSRHWFFKGKMEIDGVPQAKSLMQLVQGTLEAAPTNSVVAFADNSSAIAGFDVPCLLPAAPGCPGQYSVAPQLRHCLLTAETHNMPTGVAPFPGAETGTGGRIRDTHATGRGSHVIAGTAAYCVGNLRIPGYTLPWEDAGFGYPDNLAKPLTIELDASNGASDYGNKFGEPLVAGFTRSVGVRLPDGERREYLKPIMFTAGIGAIDDEHTRKGEPEPGMLVVKLGGPAYRIGMGGSAASSMMQGSNRADLDFNAVQRGDAEMEQKVNRVVRACVELGKSNPIISIHDQGAGGNCNVLKEIVSPAGGIINVRDILTGDSTLSVMEIWGAEYQEADALLLRPESRDLFSALCRRERVPVAFVGVVTGDGRVQLRDSADGTTPVDMDLEKVLGSMPSKTFQLTRKETLSEPFVVPEVSVTAALNRVLRLLSVGSKRFLTNKVDRSVTGLVAQQQCVGPLHTPLADCAVIALSHFGTRGIASSIGEQPLKGLVSPVALARMSVGEAITNLAGARVTALGDVKCSANWMWAAKLPHEGAALYDACAAMSAFMIACGVAVDGGKDSLSMAAKAPDGELVKAPGSLVISLYCPCPDITLTVTPDLKAPGASTLILVDLSARKSSGVTPKCRIGGSALAQVFGAVGNLAQVPDCEDPALLVAAFGVIQSQLERKGATILSLHDRSDGGLVVSVAEMAFAGNCGVHLALPAPHPTDGTSVASTLLRTLFSEELGWVIECPAAAVSELLHAFHEVDVCADAIGVTTTTDVFDIVCGADATSALPVYEGLMTELRDVWEATSFQLERLQSDPACVAQEEASMKSRTAPPFTICGFTPTPPRRAPGAAAHVERPLSTAGTPRVAVIRQEGTNGDREMAASLHMAGFEVWDITMSDLLDGRAVIDSRFRGVAFPGGFSYADVLDSAKGWAGVIRLHKDVLAQLTSFYTRTDTFSLGVCNGCQLSALLGWVPYPPGDTRVTEATQPRFIHNASGRFESRFSTVRINDSPSIMLRGMSGSVLGVWVAHGEGRAHFPNPATLEHVLAAGLVPLSYVDDAGVATEAYPFNPNGSPKGIAGLCTVDGRHLALMPHPERTTQLWQWPWMPTEWKATLKASPWQRMFDNAFTWCVGNEEVAQ